MEKASPRNPSPYITKTPLDYLTNGEVRRVPWMVGFVRNEGVMKAKGMYISTCHLRQCFLMSKL